MFVDEIRQQPGALRDLIDAYRAPAGAAALEQVGELFRARSAGGPVLFTGMGSSLYATDAVIPRLVAGGIDAASREAGEWLHYGMGAADSSRQGWAAGLVVAVSQSGESAETRMLAERLSGRVPVVAVTNDPQSRMAKAADVVLPMYAGFEMMIAAKTYTNTVGVLHLAASALLQEERSGTFEALAAAAGAMEPLQAPAFEGEIQQAAEWLDAARSIHALARGPSLAAARGGALVLGEGAHLAVSALPAGSFRHGPLELSGPGHVAMIFAPKSRTRELMVRLAADLAQAGSRVILLADEPAGESGESRLSLPVAGSAGEAYFPLLTAILVERLLVAVAERRGLEPGRFQFSGKITDRE